MNGIKHHTVADLPPVYRIVLITREEAAERDAQLPPGGDGTPSVARLEGTDEEAPPYVSAAALAYMIEHGLTAPRDCA